ncbi:unnamed protein product [Effrenium voratum]|uniref:Cyclic nucleotide-binding domain-containing protein n=1 Tax=Effrenium voratum TaxID=2562239 RepID=A0AA36MW93_9DINO|nr:unnamed protein product [Effrenium voratum]
MLLFWNLDFFASLCTGFYDEGRLIMSWKRIAVNYAKTWMFFDLSLISMDWSFRILDWAHQAPGNWSKSLRMLRFLRLLRMLRWIKLRKINEVTQELFHTQAASLYYGLFSSIATLLVTNHLLACAWFAMSHVYAENWVTDLGIENGSVEYQYLTCLNWAFAQLGVGSSPAQATNSLETAFCIFSAFRSLITSSTLISTVSNLMAWLSKIKEDESDEFRRLRAHLANHNIPHALSQKITNFLQYQYAVRKEARSADVAVPLLDLLSQQLQGELQFARYEQALRKLVLLEELMETADRQVVHTLHCLAVRAVRTTVVAGQDVVFLAGQEADCAYLKLTGAVSYLLDGERKEFDESGWMAEVSLWVPWFYLGDLVSEDVTRLVAVDAEGFAKAVGKCWTTQRSARKYAARFVEVMQKETNWSDMLTLRPALPRTHSILTAAKSGHCCPDIFKRKGRVVGFDEVVSNDGGNELNDWERSIALLQALREEQLLPGFPRTSSASTRRCTPARAPLAGRRRWVSSRSCGWRPCARTSTASQGPAACAAMRVSGKGPWPWQKKRGRGGCTQMPCSSVPYSLPARRGRSGSLRLRSWPTCGARRWPWTRWAAASRSAPARRRAAGTWRSGSWPAVRSRGRKPSWRRWMP